MFDSFVIIIVISAVKCNVTHQFVSVMGYQKKKKPRKPLAFNYTERKKGQNILLSFRKQRDDHGYDFWKENRMYNGTG